MYCFPSLITLALCPLNFFKASKDFSALFSCITPITAFAIITIIIIIVSVKPSPFVYPTIPDIIAAIINTIIIKSLNCSKNLIIRLFFFFPSNSFKPYSAFLLSTSSCHNPTISSVSKDLITSSEFKLYHFFCLFCILVFSFLLFHNFKEKDLPASLANKSHYLKQSQILNRLLTFATYFYANYSLVHILSFFNFYYNTFFAFY